MWKLKLDMLPRHMHGAMTRWIDNGIQPGDFLSAVLCNDLREAVARADDVNVHALADYVRFLHSYAPAGCWGSELHFAAWRKTAGLNGLLKEAEDV